MKKVIRFVSLLVSFCFSCDKKELPVPAYDRGDLNTVQIEIGSDYRNQVWFSLHDNKIVSSNLKTDWDLAFEASPGGTHIFLNGSKAMKVFKTAFSNLSQVQDTVGLAVNSQADVPSGNPDSTAIGDWTDGKVYILHRGYNSTGQVISFYKMKIVSVDADGFTFEYASLKSSEVKLGKVVKNDAYNFIAYSFNSDAQLTIEPMKTDFDLCFTQYTHVFYEPEFQYYQVTGVLQSTYRTRVAKISGKSFADISLNDTLAFKFETRRDRIGYDWKDFNLNTNVYTVNPKMCYIIQDNHGFFFKLHFIDFLNASGLKGYPKFEFKKL
jgi:hypothetical protein